MATCTGSEHVFWNQYNPWFCVLFRPHWWWRRGDGRRHSHKWVLNNVAWVSAGCILRLLGTSPACWTWNNSFVWVSKVEFISIVEMLKTAAGNFVILLILKSKCQFSTNSKNTATFTVLPSCLSWWGGAVQWGIWTCGCWKCRRAVFLSTLPRPL